ncbi:MAG: HNH endonuclease, partial [Anaeromyxobacteraceae bacterium]
GIAARTAQDLARLAPELATRPLLPESVRRGEVSARKAQAVLPVARGEEEASWVERARVETVRALAAAVRELHVVGGDDPADEPWERVFLPLAPAARETLDRAMALAGQVLGATAPKWQRLEAICAEYLGAHPVDEAEDAGGPFTTPSAGWLDGAKAALEEETRRWAFLDELSPADPVAAPPSSDATEALQLDGELRGLVALRHRWDDVLGHLAMLLQQLGLWRDMRFASLAHYCAERLGMAARTVEQRAALARRLHALPALRGALRDGRVSYEQARLVARAADDSTVAAWIDRAERTTCVALRREVEAADEAQMCARGELDLRLPRTVAGLLSTACRAARAAEGRWLSPGECLACIAEHFIATWEGALPRPRTAEGRAIARDGGLCQVPGCSRAAAHAHHVTYRSRGGGDEPANLVALCAAHHLVGVHGGYLRVSGQAPGALRWDVGGAAAA